MSKYATDEQRLQQLATGHPAIWRQLYDELRSPFRLFFLKHSRQAPEIVNELFQDAMVVLHRKITAGDLQAPLQSSLKTYLFGVGKMLYRKLPNAKAQWADDIPEIAIPASVENKIAEKERANWVRDILGRMDETCRELLRKVYLQGFSMEAVAEDMQLNSAGTARKRKFDCLKKARQLIK